MLRKPLFAISLFALILGIFIPYICIALGLPDTQDLAVALCFPGIISGVFFYNFVPEHELLHYSALANGFWYSLATYIIIRISILLKTTFLSV